MIVLTFGRKLPETSDKGNVFFPALEDNITLNDAHDHDGTNSKALQSHNMTPGTLAVDLTGYSVSGNLYRKTVTMPSGYEFETSHISVRLNGGTRDKEQIFPKMEYVSATSFLLYMPTNSQAVNLLVK